MGILIDNFLDAARSGNLDRLKEIIESGIGINACSGGQVNTLMLASIYNHFEIARYLLEKGILINSVDRDGWTALYTAALNKSFRTAKLLLEHSANPNIRSKHDISPLQIALKNGTFNIVLLLHRYGHLLDRSERELLTSMNFVVRFRKDIV